MSNVTLEIAGRKFAVACDPGEEARLDALGRMIDGKIAGMPQIAAQSEARALLFAALLLADEIYESRQSGKVADISADDTASDVAEPLEALAEKLEAIAAQLEKAAA